MWVLFWVWMSLSASAAELRFYPGTQEVGAAFATSRSQKPLSLDVFFSSAGACFTGDYVDLKALLAKMAAKYTQKNGDMSSYTIDSQTLNGVLHKVSLHFTMRNGAQWDWLHIPRCQKK